MRRQAQRQNFPPRRLLPQRCPRDGRILSRRRRPNRISMQRPRSYRPPLESRPQSLPSRNSKRRRPCTDHARPPARQLHLRQENQPHRRQPGPAPSHGPRLAPPSHSRRHPRARLHHAHAPRQQFARKRSLRPRHARCLVSEKRTSRSRCAPGNRPLSPPQRQIHPPLRIRLAPPSPPQMDHAHLLQRPGGNLPGFHGRTRPAPRSPPRTHSLHRPPLPHPRRHYDPHLHRRLPLLRHQSLARLPQHHPPHLANFTSSLGFERRSDQAAFELPSRQGLPNLFPLHMGYTSRIMQKNETVSGALNIPDDKKIAARNPLLDRAMSSIALAFMAGFWLGVGFYWHKKPGSSYVWIGYFISAPVFLGIAIWRVYSMFSRTRADRDSIGA